MRAYKRSLGWKFSLVVVVTISLFGISAFIVGQGLDLIKQRLERKDAAEARLLEISELNSLFKSKDIALHDVLAGRDEGHAERFRELSAAFRGRAQALLQSELADEQKLRLEQIVEKDAAYDALFAESIAPAGANGDPRQALAADAGMRDEITALLERMLDEEQASRSGWSDQTYSQIRGNTLVLAFSILVSAIVGLTLVVLVSRNVQRSLHEVVHMADEIAGKKLHIPDMEYLEEDEIGRLADSMNRMKMTLKNLLEEITRTSGTVADESKKLTRITGVVGTGSGEITATMRDLSRRSESQAETSSRLAERMEHYSAQIAAVVRDKDLLSSRSQRMFSLTMEGSAHMESSTEKMNAIDGSIDESLRLVKGLDEKTAQISAIVKVIKDIADQTGLLALNAAIEAAKAGEHGRSFSVVADNVRKLSEQVQASVGHIARVAADIQQESKNAVHSLDRGYRMVSDGKTLVETTGDTFRRLEEEIDEIGAQIGRMSASLDEVGNQTVAIRSFLRDTVAMAEQTAAGVSEVTSIAEEFRRAMEEVQGSVSYLGQEADKLNAMINQFRL